eukprot:13754661-Heterocapsa_arctica.AAC.1
MTGADMDSGIVGMSGFSSSSKPPSPQSPSVLIHAEQVLHSEYSKLKIEYETLMREHGRKEEWRTSAVASEAMAERAIQ